MPICETLAHRELTKHVPASFSLVSLVSLSSPLSSCLSLSPQTGLNKEEEEEARQVERCVRAAALTLLFSHPLHFHALSFFFKSQLTRLTLRCVVIKGDSSRATRQSHSLFNFSQSLNQLLQRNKTASIVVVIVYESIDR